ncbi:MAG: glycosyltransferase family 4 protein, partial [Terriglobales bacterium]
MNPAPGALPATAARAGANPRRLRVLVLDEYFPYPPDSGKPIRTWNLLRQLATRHDITLLCHGHLTPEQAEAARTAGMHVESVDAIPPEGGLALYAKLLLNMASPYPYSVAKHHTARFREKLGTVLGNGSFDLVHCEWTPYARYLSSIKVPTLIATHNIESQIWARRAERASNPLAKIFFRIQASKMERFERSVLARAQAVTGVSAADAAQAKAWGAAQVSVVDNGVDLRHFAPQGEGAGDRAVFIGALEWFPNVDAVQFFVDAIQPRLEKLLPNFRTKIIGRRAPESLKRFLGGCSGIDFAGEVPDTRPHLAEAGLVIVPLRIGGGSRLKILEALAMGKAVVSTTIGAEG